MTKPPPERRSRLALGFFGWLTSSVLRLLGATWRIEVLGEDPTAAGPNAPPILAALFHESLLPSVYTFRDRGYSVAISRSRDGDLIAASLAHLGYAEPIRGSSSSGGSTAILGLVRLLAEGTSVAVLVDGPRGPARVPKPGILSVARHSGALVQPVAFAARPALRLGSWDRSLLPLPFARIVCAFGETLEVGPRQEGADGDEDSELLDALARRLDGLRTRANEALGPGAACNRNAS